MSGWERGCVSGREWVRERVCEWVRERVCEWVRERGCVREGVREKVEELR